MRKLADVFGLLVTVAGVLCVLSGCLLSGHPVASVPFWLGIVLIVSGLVISNAVSKKTCPQCAERVKVKALKCRHCGHDFALAARLYDTKRPQRRKGI